MRLKTLKFIRSSIQSKSKRKKKSQKGSSFSKRCYKGFTILLNIKRFLSLKSLLLSLVGKLYSGKVSSHDSRFLVVLSLSNAIPDSDFKVQRSVMFISRTSVPTPWRLFSSQMLRMRRRLSRLTHPSPSHHQHNHHQPFLIQTT